MEKPKLEKKIKECVCPERPCRGCAYSYYPKLYDGGCMFSQNGEKELLQIFKDKGPGAAATEARRIRWKRWEKNNEQGIQ